MGTLASHAEIDSESKHRGRFYRALGHHPRKKIEIVYATSHNLVHFGHKMVRMPSIMRPKHFNIGGPRRYHAFPLEMSPAVWLRLTTCIKRMCNVMSHSHICRGAQWRRLHGVQGREPPLLQMAGHWTSWVKEQQTRNCPSCTANHESADQSD